MSPIISKISLYLWLLAGPTLLLSIFACGVGTAKESAAKEESDTIHTPADRPLADFQKDLLELAFDTATAIPTAPHIKDRCKTQAEVVAACLELGQAGRALGYLEKIDNWRRGACYADLGFYCAQQGEEESARRCLDFASEISKNAEDWRRDTIRIKIAKTYTLLGQNNMSDLFAKDVVDSEKGKVAGAKAMTGDKGSFDEQMQALDALIEPGNFDILRNALEACAQLFNRFYNDAPRRAQAEEKIKTSWDPMPIFIRIDLLLEMAGFALDHADQAKALELVNEARDLLDACKWPLKNHIAMAAKLAALRFQAGDQEKARAEADAELALYREEGDKIVSIWRAGALRPLAEAYQAMDDTDAALDVYRLAVEEGVVNPNSRPRAEDLSATCCSMALHAADPDAELWTQMRQIREGLGQPW